MWRGSRRWIKLAISTLPVCIYPAGAIAAAWIWPGHFYAFPLGFLLLSLPLIAVVFIASIAAVAA